MNNDGQKFVEYEKWCKTCVHMDLDESEDPCHDCLQTPVNTYSSRPYYYEGDDTKNTAKRNTGHSRGL